MQIVRVYFNSRATAILLNNQFIFVLYIYTRRPLRGGGGQTPWTTKQWNTYFSSKEKIYEKSEPIWSREGGRYPDSSGSTTYKNVSMFSLRNCVRKTWEGRGAKVLHTDIQTYRPSEEVGPRGAFAPKKRSYFKIPSSNVPKCFNNKLSNFLKFLCNPHERKWERTPRNSVGEEVCLKIKPFYALLRYVVYKVY